MNRQVPKKSKQRWGRWSLASFLIFSAVTAVILSAVIRYGLSPREHLLTVMGAVTYGDEVRLPVLTKEEIRNAIGRQIRAGQSKEFQSDFKDFYIEAALIEPVEERLDPERNVPLIGYAWLHHRVFRCELVGEQNGSVVRRIVLVDQNHFHLDEDFQHGPFTSGLSTRPKH